ncbi:MULTISPECIES: hypothetical protein [unclassified Mesorhizobium]|uniref:hypothetical protein n=1 Tax=unclassified Mesorhizobium TaxID=325217 RepID=UPI0010933EC5|nr:MULTISPECIES: hypothetical protein [unclassified Mesorhizobium]TGT90903.1 hypothetical protein EN804_06090 [Mesorhizobium sp. M8A.F.Ca.ET.161.01.1.1]TGV43817.1 hypothetical protein EN785_07455 [Mesorhizobium sp. M8A.F.Ca.ET.142.01.1.1]
MKFEELTFVGIDSSGEFPKPLPWNPKRTGNYSEDCATGRECFRELHEFMLMCDNPSFLVRVLSAQVQGGTWEGVEIGFSQAMSEKLFLA